MVKGYSTFLKTRKRLPRGWMRLDCKGQPTYKYAGVGGALSATPLGPSGVLSVPYADLLHQVDPEGNYKAEAFRRYALFESVAALLKLATDRIGDESVEHLANQAQISSGDVIAYIESKEREELQENATQTAFHRIRQDGSFLTERSTRELCGVDMREADASKAMRQLDELFSCHITKELFKDPVICSNGHTFERKAIEQWLLLNQTCPKSRDRISSILVPNHALRNVLDDFVTRHANQMGDIWKPIREACAEYQRFMDTVGRVNHATHTTPVDAVSTPVAAAARPTFLSDEQRRSLASLPDIYIDIRLESWQRMIRRYRNFDVWISDAFGIRMVGSGFSTSGNRERYEQYIRGERGGRFVELTRFELLPGQRPLHLTGEHELRIQLIRDTLRRSQREYHAHHG